MNLNQNKLSKTIVIPEKNLAKIIRTDWMISNKTEINEVSSGIDHIFDLLYAIKDEIPAEHFLILFFLLKLFLN